MQKHIEVQSDLDCADCLCRVCAKNEVNDSRNPTAPYKDCGCNNCGIGNLLVETDEDCKGFTPDCDDCDRSPCEGETCQRIEEMKGHRP